VKVTSYLRQVSRLRLIVALPLLLLYACIAWTATLYFFYNRRVEMLNLKEHLIKRIRLCFIMKIFANMEINNVAHLNAVKPYGGVET
jgi:hypothetical protein